jgi:hypothetical protein
MWSALISIGSFLGSLAPGLFGYLNKRADVSVQKDQIDRSAESADLATEAGSITAANQAKVAQQTSTGGWWHLIAFTFGMAAAVHFAAVCWVSTFPFWGWKVLALPSDMAQMQTYIGLSFFVGSLILGARK